MNLGRFQIEDILGAGGMGTVYKGRHLRTNDPAAIKVINAASARSKHIVEAFQREVRAAAGLRHPGITFLYDYGLIPAEADAIEGASLVPGSPYFVMEYASAGSLAEFELPLPWPHLRTVLLSILDALAHAHGRGLVHRDIKPANILAVEAPDGSYHWKLSDFGVAYSFRTPLDGAGAQFAMSGTPRSMAPEQFRGQWRDFGPWTDLYSLGCLAYRLATGRPPFSAQSTLALYEMHCDTPFPDLGERSAYYPLEFQAWLQGLTEKDPRQRFQRAADAAFGLLLISAPPRYLEQTPLRRRTGDSDEATEVYSAPATVILSLSETEAPAAEGLETAKRPLPPIPVTWERFSEEEWTPDRADEGLGLFGLRPPPFVGRRPERDLIWRALRDVSETKSPRMVAISGERGLGKTRLARWICERSHETGAAIPIFIGHQPGEVGDVSLRRALSRFLQTQGLSREELRNRLELVMAPFDDLDSFELHALAGVLLDPNQRGAHQLPPQNERFLAILHFLHRLATIRPVVLAMDNVHWSSEGQEFLQFLLETGQDSPFPILAVVTHDESFPASQPEVLEPLSDAEMKRLVRSLLPLREELVQELSSTAQGNPLFAIQWINARVLNDELVSGVEGYELPTPAASAPLADLAALWMERLRPFYDAGPGDAVQRALEIAAAFGEEVSLPEWEEVLRDASVPISTSLLDRLARQGLIHLESGSFRFCHRMTGELLQDLARKAGRYREHHRRIAAAFQHPQARIGHHLLEGGQPQEAFPYLFSALQEAEESVDLPQAFYLADRCLQALDVMPDNDETRRSRAQVELLRASLLSRELHNETFEVAEALLNTARHEGWVDVEADALFLLGRVERMRVHLDRAFEHFQHANQSYLALGQALGEARAIQGMGHIDMVQGLLARAQHRTGHALKLFRELGYLRGEAWCLSTLGDLARKEERFDEARVYYLKAQDLFSQTSESSGLLWSLHDLAQVDRARGDLENASRGYRQTLQMAEATGHTLMAPRFNLGLVEVARGHFARAEAIFSAILQDTIARGQVGHTAIARACMMPCLAARAAWQECRSFLPEISALLLEEGLHDQDVFALLEETASMAEPSQPALASELRELLDRAKSIT